jgi:hypothetical protein
LLSVSPAPTFSDVGSLGLPAAQFGSAAWGDYNADGKLDVLITGADSSSTPIAKLYRNDGGGTFTEVSAGLTGVQYSSAAWGDYNNDGWLDILLTGANSSGTAVAKLYRNNSGGSFSEISAGLTGVSGGAAAWGDYDNDGRLDILLSGSNTSSTPITTLYRNNGDGTFSSVSSASLTGATHSSVAWGDYNNDGRLDILLTGTNSSGTVITKLYRNNGSGSFSEVSAGLTGVSGGAAAWGDYDADGYLDLVVTGNSSSGIISKIYHNKGDGTF